MVVDPRHGLVRAVLGPHRDLLREHEDFRGRDALVALHLPVVPRCVWLGSLMPGALPDDAGKVAGAVASAIVGDDPVDVVDAVGGEPDLRPGKESSSRRALHITERFCVGEP
ncbi:hypothetical protein [Streptomyces sp. Ag109_O5-1]|uniref:hypothetical protein n=1 Tax=Streptomyces sp. Ag109_O5-1 TaxID=1938851 RepID=UPI0037D9A74E